MQHKEDAKWCFQWGSCLTTEFLPLSEKIRGVWCPDVHTCSSVFVHGGIVPAGWTETLLGFLNWHAHLHAFYMHARADTDSNAPQGWTTTCAAAAIAIFSFILPRQPFPTRISHNASAIKSIMDSTLCLFLRLGSLICMQIEKLLSWISSC